jgi:hypothetical protein
MRRVGGAYKHQQPRDLMRGIDHGFLFPLRQFRPNHSNSKKVASTAADLISSFV